ncbi:hypothetical protein CYG49_01730 [Candidatus Saccharibacteria bacterium]|nr:MAG: hypothetical protein CYG49_01730 [Candidatus Saccharibacteria bacterium]
MKIGILSDTHDRQPTLQKALTLLLERDIDYLIHCGDWTKPETVIAITEFTRTHGIPFSGVLGNRDDHEQLIQLSSSLSSALTLPPGSEVLHLAIDNRRITVYHGHHKPTLKRLIDTMDYDALLTGHTHKPRIDEVDQRLIINPGSTAFSIPRKKEPRSVAIYDTSTHSAEILYFEA